ncbi:MAG TPA: tRNA (adenosine(37)-N6)-threonylcarbamoyltransferase complex ATPase subunit type 1 TsaE [Alphaproteobacteria bacterium]
MTDSQAPVAAASLALADLAATASLAARTAALARAGDVIALRGDLGAGKTAFARAFIRARPGGADVTEVPSPTFTLVQVYDLAPAVWHFDLYRLTRADDVWELGFEEALADAILLIEWPDRLGSLLPAEHLDVELTPGSAPDSRDVRLIGTGDWVGRLDGLAGRAAISAGTVT